MLSAILAIGGLGFVAGVGLAAASKIFYVYVDPLIVAVEEALPGANCGGCGFPGCSGAAEAIATGKAPPTICVGGGPATHAKVASILGIEIKEVEPEIARPGCYYGPQEADLKYIYDGLNDCRAAMLLGGGAKECPVGCLGLGSCVKACPFGALSMGEDGLPRVNASLCTGCGTCERVCPKHIITLTSNSRRVTQEYTLDQCSAPCQRTCPAGIDIPAYIDAAGRGDYLEAVRIIKEKNPFPLVCGRICVHPCENECRRNLLDEPVAINPIKRFVADFEMKSGSRIPIEKAPPTGKRIAVIGGGAEGLTAAFFLARLGHEPTVYEGKPHLGGLLRTIIPDSRLPKDVLDWEIQGILETGVTAHTNTKLGRDVAIGDLLQEGYDAVFVATGGWDSQMSEGLPTEPYQMLPGVHLLVHLSFAHMAGKAPQLAGDAMIVGCGNASIDAAHLLKTLGAQHVHVVFRGSRQESPFTDEELQAAEAQGITFHFRSAITRMFGRAGDLTHVEVASLEKYVPGQTLQQLHEQAALQHIPVQTLVTGAGRFPELIYAPVYEQRGEGDQQELVRTDHWETVVPYAGPFAEEDVGIFRPGEATTDYKAVVEAIGAGRRGAASVHKRLMGEEVAAPPGMIRRSTRVLTVDTLEPLSPQPREKMPALSPVEQMANPEAEVELGFSEEQVRREAQRCLRCGLICYRRPLQEPESLAKSA
ncbi:electron transport complex, RnfABCDGE type, B subunit [Desulfacinum hydrothermale DSM 13146]|uniref:Ion-translocating oxidoreductase complex subunit B n=1 Tax=Desulfacinum hydrothermale DSM 13146 TaxID=1121390 RepID=A0A1W1XUY4_9BACT|nr:RnfABCDGE type electron transport complex subunit B [Desulfacinum hydrothermale]SMC27338.1 electron transport complex, RnfABCDGE type, B subunit [Desulfacinum hydrothermale DSM 13146]